MDISFISTKRKVLFLTVSAVAGEVLVDGGGCRGGLCGKRPGWASGCWPRLTQQFMHSQGHLVVSQSELKHPQVSKKSKKEDLTM